MSEKKNIPIEKVHKYTRIALSIELYNNEPFRIIAKQRRPKERNKFKVTPTQMIIRQKLANRLFNNLLRKTVAPIFDTYVKEVKLAKDQDPKMIPPFAFFPSIENGIESIKIVQTYDGESLQGNNLVDLGYISITQVELTT